MTNSVISPLETTQEAIKSRWGFHSTKIDLPFENSDNLGEIVENLKGMYSAAGKAFACAKVKCIRLKKRMQTVALHNVIARLMPCKTQASRSHRCAAKSAKNSSSSGSSDGSDPDPEAVPSPRKVVAFKNPFQKLIQHTVFFARTLNNEVAK